MTVVQRSATQLSVWMLTSCKAVPGHLNPDRSFIMPPPIRALASWMLCDHRFFSPFPFFFFLCKKHNRACVRALGRPYIGFLLCTRRISSSVFPCKTAYLCSIPSFSSSAACLHWAHRSRKRGGFDNILMPLNPEDNNKSIAINHFCVLPWSLFFFFLFCL